MTFLYAVETRMLGIIRKGNVVVIVPKGAFDHKMSAEMEAKIFDYIDRGVVNFLLDLTKVKGILSRGVHSLIELHARAKEKGGNVKLSGLQRDVKFVLEFAQLNQIFEIFEEQKAALASFGITDGPRPYRGDKRY
ncbi:MAG TPA: anti-sigma factor antagonist [Planctomycetes bacterium]|nr:anti-sigma factor antagonist [Planctomycetota bacterium]